MGLAAAGKRSRQQTTTTTTTTTRHSFSSSPSTTSPTRRRSSATSNNGSIVGSSAHFNNNPQPSFGGVVGSWSVGLNVESLEKLLCESIPPFLSSVQERQALFQKFRGLASRCNKSQQQAANKKQSEACRRAELDEAAVFMSDFLCQATSRRLSATLLADLHSSIGLIRDNVHGNTHAAIESHIKALWILHRRQQQQQQQQDQQRRESNHSRCNNKRKQRSSSSLPSSDCDYDDQDAGDGNTRIMAVIMYRLANSYGRIGDYKQMHDLMAQAQVYYHHSNKNNTNQNSLLSHRFHDAGL